MFIKKTVCLLKTLINMLFALLSVVLVIGGLVLFFVGLIAYFNAEVGMQAIFSGVIFTWLGCFGLLNVMKNGCPMLVEKGSE